MGIVLVGSDPDQVEGSGVDLTPVEPVTVTISTGKPETKFSGGIINGS